MPSNYSKAKVLFSHLKTKYQNCQEEVVIVITGDFVDSGEKESFLQVNELLKDLRESFKVFCCPGNGDYGYDGVASLKPHSFQYFHKYVFGDKPSENFCALSEEVYPCFNQIKTTQDEKPKEYYIFVGLDSMQMESGKTGYDGEIGKDQLSQMSQILETYSNNNAEKEEDPYYFRIIYLHHHPYIYEKFKAIKDKESFEKIMIDNDVDMVLFGHKHISVDLSKDIDCSKWVFGSHSSTDTEDLYSSLCFFDEIKIRKEGEDKSFNVKRKTVKFDYLKKQEVE